MKTRIYATPAVNMVNDEYHLIMECEKVNDQKYIYQKYIIRFDTL